MSPHTSCAPEHWLALALVGTRCRREANHSTITELAARSDLYTLEALLRAQGVLSLVGQRLLELTDLVTDEFAAHVREHVRLVERQGVGQQMITLRLSAALTDAGVRTLPLKGPLLGERIHGELGVRVSADIDLLVAPSDLVAAIEVLSELGYRRAPRAQPPQLPRSDLHECLRSTVDLPEVELHWRIHHYEQQFSQEMLRRATPGPDGCLRPEAADELIALLLFYARDGMAGLRLLGDLTAWWDRFGRTLPPGKIHELVREHPVIVPAVASAAVAAQRLGGLPADELFEPEILSRASDSAIRMSNWCLSGRRSHIAANLFMIDCLLTPREQRRALLTRHLWRDEAALYGEWLETALTRRGLTRARLLHLARVSARCLVALWQLRRGREWAPLPAGMSPGGRNEK